MKAQFSLKQIDKKIFLAILAVASALLISALAPRAAHVNFGRPIVDASYPATVCPSAITGATSVAYLPNPKIGVRIIKSSSVKMKSARTYRANLSNPLFIEGNPQSTMVANSSSGWFASSICEVGAGESWFVGGSAGISSAGYIDLVNSGLSESTVDLLAYSSQGPEPIYSVVIPPNSEKKVPLDTLAPGEEKIVVHAITRSGRVTAFYIDIRKQGLRSLGADYVSPATVLSKTVILPGLINNVSKGAPLSQVVRVLVPGAVDGSIGATIHSVDGSFSPVGLDNLRVPHGQVVEVKLPDLTVSTPFAIVIKSDQPVIAGALSRTQKGVSDFAWSGAATALPKNEPISINLGGHTPLISFYSPGKIEVRVSYNLASGKSSSATIIGDRKVSWRPTGGVNRIEVQAQSKEVYGALLYSGATNGGLSYMPLRAGATLNSSVLPHSDARVISRGGSAQ